ncbi:hypothetical protein Avbf_13501 [Armadillidium vulgare]|nr:hypothetical protein Avbf_13501 [Armadillidium vulgare]
MAVERLTRTMQNDGRSTYRIMKEHCKGGKGRENKGRRQGDYGAKASATENDSLTLPDFMPIS